LQPSDESTASVGTGLSLFPIGEMKLLVSTFAPVGGEEIAYAGSPAGNGFFQNRLHRLIQLRPRRLTNPRCRSVRMKPDPKQNLVRIDIADPGDHLLVHQERLESAASFPQ